MEPKALSRTTDPESSGAAADRMNTSGRASKQRQAVVELVHAHPGKTSRELSELCGELDRYQVARRLPEARDSGAICCRKNGASPCTWFPREQT